MVIHCGGSKAPVTMNTKNSLEANIHKDIVRSRDAFVLLIDAWREDHSENEETFLGAIKQYRKCYNII